MSGSSDLISLSNNADVGSYSLLPPSPTFSLPVCPFIPCTDNGDSPIGLFQSFLRHATDSDLRVPQEFFDSLVLRHIPNI